MLKSTITRFHSPILLPRRFRHALHGLSFLSVCALGSAAPLNDNFANAQSLSLGTTVAGTTLDATREAGDPEPAAHSRSVWYSYTPAVSQLVRLSGTTSDDPLAAYLVSGNTLLSSALLDDGVFTSRVLPFYAVAGRTYRICVDDYVPGYINYHGYPFTLGLAGGAALPADTRFIQPLSNDSFDQATLLTGSSATLVLNSNFATFEPFEKEMLARFTPAPSYNRNGVGGLWLSWTAPASGQATITAETPASSKVVIVLGQGSSIANLNLLKGEYNGLIFTAQKGSTYKIYLLSQTDSQVLCKLTSTATGGEGPGTPDPAKAHSGTYTGLQEDSLLTVTLAANQAFTGRLTKAGVPYVLKGRLDSTGSFTGTFSGAATPFSLVASGGSSEAASDDTFVLKFDATNVTARPRAYAVTELPATAGSYTLLLKAGDSSAAIPQGTGYARLSIAKGGTAKLTGKLADGTALSSAGILRAGSSSPQLDLYNTTLYARKGRLAGTLTFPASAAANLTGVLDWIKPATGRGAYYPAGFTSHLSASGARYVAPPSGALALPLSNSIENIMLSIAGGNLTTQIKEKATLTSANQVSISGTNPAKLIVTVVPKTGLLTGSFIHPLTHKPVSFTGALSQSSTGAGAYGYFLGPVANGVGQSGLFSLTPR